MDDLAIYASNGYKLFLIVILFVIRYFVAKKDRMVPINDEAHKITPLECQDVGPTYMHRPSKILTNKPHLY